MMTFNLFWNQFGQKDNSFDKHFDKQDLILSELLDDDAIIGEFRNSNQKLMNFLKPEHYIELIDYITKLPPEAVDTKRLYRYPFYACEILCCDNSTLVEAFFPREESVEEHQNEDETKSPDQLTSIQNLEGASTEIPEALKKVDLFAYLCKFIEQNDSEKNLVLTGYFGKVFSNLIQRRTTEVINHIYSQEDQIFLKNLTLHIAFKSLSDVLVKLIAFDKDLQLPENNFVELRKNVIKDIIQIFASNGTQNFEIGHNISLMVAEIVQKAYTMVNGKEIIEEFLQPEVFNLLCEFSTNQNTTVSIPSSNIVCQLLIFGIFDECKKLTSRDDVVSLELDLSKPIQILGNHIPQMVKYLNQQSNQPKESIGQTRLKITEIFNILLKSNCSEVKEILAKEDIFGTMNKLLPTCPFNNLFHLQYQQMIEATLKQQIQPLIKNLFEQNKYLEYLLDLTKNIQSLRDQKKSSLRPGYIGTIIQISKLIEETAKQREEFSKYIDNPQWSLYKDHFLTKTLNESEKELAGPTTHKDSEEGEGQFDFSKEDISVKFQEFLSNNSNQTSEAKEDQEETVQPTLNMFDGFGASTGTGGIEVQAVNFNSFAWDAPNQPENNSAENQSASWEAFENVPFQDEPKQIQQTPVESIQQIPKKIEQYEPEEETQEERNIQIDFWKLKVNDQLTDEAFLEFEKNL